MTTIEIIWAVGDKAWWRRNEKDVPVVIRKLDDDRLRVQTASGLTAAVPVEHLRRRVDWE